MMTQHPHTPPATSLTIPSPCQLKVLKLIAKLVVGTPPDDQDMALDKLTRLFLKDPPLAARSLPSCMPAILPLLRVRALQHSTAALLTSLAKGNPTNQAAIAGAGVIPVLVELLSQGIQTHFEDLGGAAEALTAVIHESPTNQAAAAAAGAIPALASLLRARHMQGEVATALAALALGNARNQAAIAAAGAIPALVPLLECDSMERQSAAMHALGNLAFNNPVNQVAIAAAGAIPGLVGQLDQDSLWHQAQAVRALLNLSTGNAENQAAIAAAGGIDAMYRLTHSEDVDLRDEAGFLLAMVIKSVSKRG